MSERARRALEQPVFDGAAYRPFGELSARDAEARAAELGELAGFGPAMRVRPVARAWAELAEEMASSGAQRVSELDPGRICSFAERLWVLHSEESMLRDPPPESPGGSS